jgi:ABC-type antimicrobial peptide transport system permease subunit
MHIQSFIKIFAYPELKSILKRIWLLLFLLIIVVAALWSIGFSKGTLSFLKAKMDNPFIKFVSVVLPNNFDDKNDFKGDLSNSINKQHFGYKNFSLIPTRYVNFLGINNKEPSGYMRMINTDDEIYKFIMSDSNMLLTPNAVSLKNSTWSCIVTESYLKKLGYSDFNNIPFINYILPGNGDTDVYVPIPVAAIVKQLPDNHDLFVGEDLFFSIRGDFHENNPLDITSAGHKNYVTAFIQTDEDEETIKGKLKELGLSDYVTSNIKPSYVNGIVIKCNTINTNADIDFSLLESKLNKFKVERYFDYSAATGSSSIRPDIDPDKLIINFSSLDSVRSFQAYLLEKHKLKIDLNTVEAKENFNFFDKISSILSLILSSFSILLIIYVITSMMFEHIEKNKKNLGTLKAFGLSNSSITILYSMIALVVITIIFIIGYLIAKLLGSAISSNVLHIYQLNIAKDSSIFNLSLDIKLLSWFIVFPLVSTAIFLTLKLRNKTPGDLIYERD